MEIIYSSPRLVQRKVGGWLAVSGASESLKIGVIAPTEQDARVKFDLTLRAWKHNLNKGSEPAVT